MYTRPGDDRFLTAVPGRPAAFSGPLQEIARWAWSPGDRDEPAAALSGFLQRFGLAGPFGSQPAGAAAVALLVGAHGCAALAGLPVPPPSPAAGVPEIVAVALRPGGRPARLGAARVGTWQPTWDDASHAAAVQVVRSAIARGDLYQANVVGHRSAAYRGDLRSVAAAVARLGGATYGGVLSGPGWAVGCASPEQLVRVTGDRVSTEPVKGTRRVRPGSDLELRSSLKDRAEHVMIVDLERNDLARVAVTGTVEVERLYALQSWSGLWQAASTVAARLRPDVGLLELLRAVAPGGSVTGAPKRAACTLLRDLEPVGRGPSMGALGLVHPGGLDLGLSIRTVAVDTQRVHLWAGGGITWGSDPADEVAEAHAKAGPLLQALAQVRPSPS